MIGESGPDFVVFLIRGLVCFLLYPLVEFLSSCGFFLLFVLSSIPFVFCLDLVQKSAFW